MLKTFILSKMFISNKLGSVKSDNKLIKKFKKPKTGKLSKFQNLLKSSNIPKFDAKEVRPSLLTFDIKKIFNCLWLAFTNTLIF